MITLLAVSIVVFIATQVLPGNAAYAILGHAATPQRLHALEGTLHLNESLPAQYWAWLSRLLTGHPGTSLVSGQSVISVVGPRIVNSAILVVLAGLIGLVLGVALGAYAAVRRDGLFDQVFSAFALAVTAMPEFVVSIGLVAVFATLLFHWLPAVSVLSPGAYGWSFPNQLVLPVATLVLVVVPYLFRMTRAAMIEALESDYTEMAVLKGVPLRRMVMKHALPNALPPIIQVAGLQFLYLAGGIVIVEDIFNYPGLGQGLVNAVNARDLPVLQFEVVVLAAFYVVVNIIADVGSLMATPRRRYPRS